VLAGAAGLFPRIRGVQVEMSLLPLYENQAFWYDMIAVLERHGFELCALVPGFFDPRIGRMLQCDSIFFRA
jgi:hypothetical protein